MAAALSFDDRAPPPEGMDGKGLVLAFVAALALHVAAAALPGAWRSTAIVSPPGEQNVTIDLAPHMIEVPSVVPVETRVGAPAEIVPLQQPVEAVQVQPIAPSAPAAAEPVEQVSAPPLADVLPPPDAVTPPEAVTTVQPETDPPVTTALAPPSSELTLVESTAVDAVPVPASQPPVPQPDAVTAQAVPEPTPAPTREHREVARPRAKPPAAREPVRPTRRLAREAPRPAAATSRRAARGAASRENTAGAAAAADPNLMSRYAAQLAAALRARLRYPDAARAVGAAGIATLRFTLSRSGQVLSATLTRSAGHPALDRAALATAAPGSSLPPAPDALAQRQLTISVPLRFDMR
jgi:protein TonB